MWAIYFQVIKKQTDEINDKPNLFATTMSNCDYLVTSDEHNIVKLSYLLGAKFSLPYLIQ